MRTGVYTILLTLPQRFHHWPLNVHAICNFLSPLFFGIIIRMFSEAGMAHHVAHFHAYTQDEAAVFSMSPVELIAGMLPQKQRRLAEAWADLQQAELIADWQLLH